MYKIIGVNIRIFTLKSVLTFISIAVPEDTAQSRSRELEQTKKS